MKAYLMFQSMPAESSLAIADWLRDSEREVFKAAIASMAAQRRLRPIFVARKTKAEQCAWLVEQLKSKLNEAAGENILQIWLMKGRSAMLATFLDHLGIPHDGKGGIEGDTPVNLDPEKVKAGVQALLAAYPATEVSVYLNLFQLQQPGGWPELQTVIDADPALQFPAKTA